MDGVIKTLAQAKKYAKKISERTGKAHLIFMVAPGTTAWDCGYRFGTCTESERADYAAGGSVFI